MVINDKVKQMIFEDTPLISFNDSSKELYLYVEFRRHRRHKNDHSYIDVIEQMSKYSIGENLIDFISISDTNLKEIREAAKLGLYNNPHMDMIEKLDCLYLYLVFNSPNMSPLKNTYINKLEYISKEIRFALDFCCSTNYDPKFNSLTNMQRYYLYCYSYPDNMHTNTWYEPSKRLVLEHDGTNEPIENIPKYPRHINSTDDPEEFAPISEKYDIPDNIVAELSQMNVTQARYYECLSIHEYLKIEFFKMIELDLKIKKCKNCGKYFVLKGDYSTDYCDRIQSGEKFTCKKLAAMKARKEKVNNNPILKEYEKAYKRNYAKFINKRWNIEEFRLWAEEATERRATTSKQYKANLNEQIVQDFKKYLGNK